MSHLTSRDPLTAILGSFRSPTATDFTHAWVGMEPTFQSKKSVRKWQKMSQSPQGEDDYFCTPYMLKTQKKVVQDIKKKYERERKAGHDYCLFANVKLKEDLDPWKVTRQSAVFYWADDSLEPFEARFTIDPETFEYSIKPVPLVWFYDDRFVRFLEVFLWQVPFQRKLTCSIAHGGGQFSLSAKTFLTGSLLADDIASKLNHPELATWIMDWPNPDDRAFRATRPRFQAFQEILRHYWNGGFHPRANGVLTAENAYLDRGFGPACAPGPDLMDDRRGPAGNRQDVFQTNFAFGRAVRQQAQNIHPGYWQSAHPDEEGYRPDQIMRYSEGNLNRLQIVGEWHVKSGKVLEEERTPELCTPLDFDLLTTEAGWENRAHMTRTSARDYTEALLLEVHAAQYLQKHPHVKIKASLLQDQLLGDAEETIRRFGNVARLEELHQEARKLNLEASRDRMNTDWVEPETLFWEAWQVLPPAEKADLAREVIGQFIDYVQRAASVDPRPGVQDNPMEWHRHRIHPVLWDALQNAPGGKKNDLVQAEWKTWQENRQTYDGRRPVFSPVKKLTPPWEERRK
jgi:hypothetical protein